MDGADAESNFPFGEEKKNDQSEAGESKSLAHSTFERVAPPHWPFSIRRRRASSSFFFYISFLFFLFLSPSKKKIKAVPIGRSTFFFALFFLAPFSVCVVVFFFLFQVNAMRHQPIGCRNDTLYMISSLSLAQRRRP